MKSTYSGRRRRKKSGAKWREGKWQHRCWKLFKWKKNKKGAQSARRVDSGAVSGAVLSVEKARSGYYLLLLRCLSLDSFNNDGPIIISRLRLILGI